MPEVQTHIVEKIVEAQHLKQGDALVIGGKVASVKVGTSKVQVWTTTQTKTGPEFYVPVDEEFAILREEETPESRKARELAYLEGDFVKKITSMLADQAVAIESLNVRTKRGSYTALDWSLGSRLLEAQARHDVAANVAHITQFNGSVVGAARDIEEYLMGELRRYRAPSGSNQFHNLQKATEFEVIADLLDDWSLRGMLARTQEGA